MSPLEQNKQGSIPHSWSRLVSTVEADSILLSAVVDSSEGVGHEAPNSKVSSGLNSRSGTADFRVSSELEIEQDQPGRLVLELELIQQGEAGTGLEQSR